MKKITAHLALALVLALLAAACSGGESSQRIERFWVGPQLVDCQGVGPQKCMQIRQGADGIVGNFYDSIDGFTHEVGMITVIDVELTDVEDPPADASSVTYRLIEIIESSPAPPLELDATAWTLRGFRDGASFERLPEGVEVTLTFDGEQINGSAGCNTFTGTAVLEGNSLTVGPLGSTRMECSPEIMAIEDRFLASMSAVETAEQLFNGRLVLAPAEGATLTFDPQ